MKTDVADWPSLSYDLVLADCFYGASGRSHVSAWFTEQVERIDNPEFARLFSDHIALPGVAALDYAHRYLRIGAGSLIGGIRFYARDLARPYVEIIAHDFEDMAALSAVVAAEWDAFAPRALRLRQKVGAGVASPQAHVDMTLYAARYEDLRPALAPVSLRAFAHPDAALKLVQERFDLMAETEPELRRNVSPSTEEELRVLWREGQLHAITTETNTLGVIATAPGQIDWIKGDEIIEEIVSQTHAGHGYAAAAQSALARLPGADPERLLIGTIDGRNFASRKTAERAGRQAVLDYVFLPFC
ncbi:hypothetical protein HCZ23_02625 [Celeribacter sp. HF31]|uniref:hypothetical protein n=1 Tax=Celeribacter sp. HF31 TaxID=2721558 RepID=UPI001431E419|nr:hypothetical protein [Celeribacter sp. HF31]NIY78364.1 hypothetical protein [Celeribacter sp. HF31]